MLASSSPMRPDAERTVPESDDTIPRPAVIRCWSRPTLAALATGARAQPDGHGKDGQRRRYGGRGVGDWRPLNVHRRGGPSLPRTGRAAGLRGAGSGGGHANTPTGYGVPPAASCKKTCNEKDFGLTA